MAASTMVNQLGVVHRGSNGVTAAFPDVCKVPLSPTPYEPIPFPNILMSGDATEGAAKTKAGASKVPVAQKAAYSPSTGDEAGRSYGVTSNGAVVTPDTPDGVRMHQSYTDARNVRKHLPPATARTVPATPVGTATTRPAALKRAVLLHAIAKRND